MKTQEITSIAKLSHKYAKALGKSSILQTKPVQNYKTEGLKYLPISDAVNFSRENIIKDNIFSKLEKEIINKIKFGKTEDARVIDKNGNLAKEIFFIGNKYSVRLFPAMLYDENAMVKFNDSTFIHNHIYNASLSSSDIYSMALLKIKKMVACTSDGSYSIIERKLPITEMNYKEFTDEAGDLVVKEILEMEILGNIRGITNTQRLKMLNQWREAKIQTFADKYSLEFKNNINELDDNIPINDNLFFIGPIKRLIDNIIIRCKKN